jgi:hypothetical protein
MRQLTRYNKPRPRTHLVRLLPVKKPNPCYTLRIRARFPVPAARCPCLVPRLLACLSNAHYVLRRDERCSGPRCRALNRFDTRSSCMQPHATPNDLSHQPNDHRRPDDRTRVRPSDSLSYQARARASTAIIPIGVSLRNEEKLLIAVHPKVTATHANQGRPPDPLQLVLKQLRVTTAQSNRFDWPRPGRGSPIVLFSARSPCQETRVCGDLGTRVDGSTHFASCASPSERHCAG